MGRPRDRARAAAAALVAAAVVAATAAGCGAGDEGRAAPGPSGSPSAGAAASAEPSDAPAPAGARPAGAGPSARGGPKVPEAELTPVTGSFTREEKAYLVDRVPKGTDPAAVLQAGQEGCDRLASTARADEDAAISAIVTGEIAGADTLVTHLCPKLGHLLTAAEGGFVDGTHTVARTAEPGRSIAPGRYRALAPSPDCTWQATGKGGGTSDSGRVSDKNRSAEAVVAAGDRRFTSSGCHAWIPEGDDR